MGHLRAAGSIGWQVLRRITRLLRHDTWRARLISEGDERYAELRASEPSWKEFIDEYESWDALPLPLDQRDRKIIGANG
jgi:hypothetical protein